MATSSSRRDVKLGVEIESAGEENLKRLAAEVRALAKAGGDAAPEYERLAESIERNAAVARELGVYKVVAESIDQTAQASLRATEAATRLRGEYEKQAAATQGLRDSQQGIAARLEATNRSINAQVEQLAVAKTALKTTDDASGALARAAAVLSDGLAKLKREAADLSIDLKKASGETKTAEAGLRSLATQSLQADAAAQGLQNTLRQQSQALEQSLQAGQRLGENFTNVAAAQERLNSAFRNSVGELVRNEAATNALAAARERSTLEAQSELLAIQESIAFGERFEQQQRAEAAAVQALTDDLDRQAALVQGRLVKSLADAAAGYSKAQVEAEKAAVAANRVNGYFEKLAAQRDVLKDAFGTTGVRSIQAIEREMFELSQALVVLRTELASDRISMQDFERATASAAVRLAALKAEVATIPGSKGRFEELADGANNLISKFGGLAAAAATVGFAIKPVIDAFIALESTTRILTQVTGSTAEAARQIDFLRKTAQQSGQSFTEVSQSYAKFAASALQAGLSTQQVQAAFKAVSLAAGNLGLSTDQAKRALEALSQIASKGTVSMEELRQQLGDALPGILPALAKQLGLTNQELNKLVESGGLLASDAIPAISAALGSLAPKTGIVDGLVASFNRFKNVLSEAGATIIDGPLGRSAGIILTALAGVVRDIAFVAVSASEGLKLIGTSVAALGSFVANGAKDWKHYGAALEQAVLESADRINSFRATAYGATGAADGLGTAVQGAATSASAAAVAFAQGGTAAAAAATQHTAVATAVTQAGTAAAVAAPQHVAVAAAVTQAGTAAAGASTQLLKLAVDYNANIEAAESAVRVSSKLVEARKSEGEALRSLADLSGVESLSKATAAKAAEGLASALRTEADANQTVLNIRVAQREALAAQALAEGKMDEARKKQLATLDELITKEGAQVEKAKQAADAAEVQAAASRLAAASLADNALRYNEFSRAVDAARLAVASVTIEMKAGRATSEDLRQANIRLAEAQGLQKDSILDQDAALKRNVESKKVDLDITTNGLKLKLEEQRTLQRYAELHGLEGQALQAKIQIKRIELEMSREVAQAKIAEADETIRSIEQTRAELDQAGILTVEKQNEFALRTANARAKRLEGEAGLEATKSIEAEIQALRGLTSAKLKHNEAVQLGNALSGIERQGLNVSADGRSQSQRDSLAQQGGVVDNSLSFGLADRAARGKSFGADEIPAILTALAAAKDNARLTTGSSVQGLGGNADASRQVNLLQQALASAQSAAAIAAAGGGGSGSTVVGSPAAVGSAANASIGAASRTVNINIPGFGSSSVSVASDADAARLEAVLKQLETAMARSGG